jgi:hypothetical protein
MAKHKDTFVPLVCKKSLARIIMHENQGCGSLGRGLQEYGAYHA